MIVWYSGAHGLGLRTLAEVLPEGGIPTLMLTYWDLEQGSRQKGVFEVYLKRNSNDSLPRGLGKGKKA